MKFGAVLPTCEIGTDPIALRDWAQAAEALGYAHIVTYDHVLGAEHAGRDPAEFALEGEANVGIGPDRWTALVDGARDAGFSHFSINCQSTTCEWGGNPAANLQNTAEHIAALESFISSVS